MDGHALWMVMKRTIVLPFAIAIAAMGLAPCLSTEQQPVLTYHSQPDRSGNFIVPSLTFERARTLHLDQDFQSRFPGHIYAQPLYWRAAGADSGMLLVATESNIVRALNAKTGKQIWGRSLGDPVPRTSLGCGNINPLGITGTPVIDPASEAIYLDAMVGGSDGLRHLVFGLSLKDGSVLPGWPVDVADALKAKGESFVARDQNERGALVIMGATLYVPFGGHFGDCGRYRGLIVGIPLKEPQSVVSWATRARGGGVWAPGGIGTDGKSLFFATGNTFGAKEWGDGEAVFRLGPDLRRSQSSQDFFAAADWRELDQQDADLGGSNPVLLDLPAEGGAQALVLALGKDGRAYLLDRHNLGGIGGALAVKTVSSHAILTAPAAYPADNGVFVALGGSGSDCPDQRPEIWKWLGYDTNELTVLKIRAGSPPAIETAWCGALRGIGSPIVTTTDGRSNPIVWIVGAEGDNRLHGFRGDTGEPLFTGGGSAELMTGLRHFQTLIAAEDRLYVAADGRVYAFTF
jgi:hypothetical protein